MYKANLPSDEEEVLMRHPRIAAAVLAAAFAFPYGVQLASTGNVYGPALLATMLVVMYIVTHTPEPAVVEPRDHWDALLLELERRHANGEPVLYAPRTRSRQRV